MSDDQHTEQPATETKTNGPSKPWHFTSDDPRRSNGRPKGLPNKLTRLAQQKLEEKASDLVDRLLELTEEMRGGEPCPMCGRGMLRADADRIRALVAALDRAGLGASSKQEVTGANGAPLEFTLVRRVIVDPEVDDGEE